METYQNQLAHALARERHAHIEAAARQLETLRQIEQMRLKDGSDPKKVGPEQLDEAHISHIETKAGADSGADSGGGGSMQLHGGDQIKSVEQDGASMRDTIGELRSPAPQHSSTRPRGVNFQGNASLQQPGFSGIRQVPSETSLLPSMTVGPQSNNTAATGSILHYADNGLSTELQRVLNRSTLDPSFSALGSGFDHSLPSLSMMHSLAPDLVENGDDDSLDRNAQRQYMMLERYHSSHRQQQP